MPDDLKSVRISAPVHRYLVAHGTPPDAIQQALIEETRGLGDISVMQISPEQGAFMTLLARAIGARRAIEIGTFTGYSALCIARGLPDDGVLVCCDVSDSWTAIGKPHWEKAGVAHKIDLRIAPALETITALPKSEPFDLAFIDADKQGYLEYYEGLLPRMRKDGIILVDNVLWGGSVADPSVSNPDANAIRSFNDRVAGDERVECVMLPIADGLTLLRKR